MVKLCGKPLPLQGVWGAATPEWGARGAKPARMREAPMLMSIAESATWYPAEERGARPAGVRAALRRRNRSKKSKDFFLLNRHFSPALHT